MPTLRSKRESGFTLVELMIGTSLSLVILLAAGALYANLARSFDARARGVLNQQDVSLVASLINRNFRPGSSYRIYEVPNREAPADSGNGLAVFDAAGACSERLEWDADRSALVDSTGARVSPVTLQAVRFCVDPDNPRTLRYSYTVDNGAGKQVTLESAVSLRN